MTPASRLPEGFSAEYREVPGVTARNFGRPGPEPRVDEDSD